MKDKPRSGPPLIRYFAPVCIKWPHGFYGGPTCYQEMLSREMARRLSPIVIPGVEERKGE